MKVEKCFISDLLMITLDVYEDERGCFYESYNKEKFISIGISDEFLQDNQSISKRNVLRGLHFQIPPFAQGKLVRVIKGAVLDVAVDLRKQSPTYKKHLSLILSAENKKLFWIPAGFAHGFITLEEDTVFSYKCTQQYHQQSERSLLWCDPEFNIDWQTTNPILSQKDIESPLFKDFSSPF